MTSTSDPAIKIKVVLLGDASVGKTSIALRFAKDRFGDTYSATIAGSFCSRSLYISNKKVVFQLWDTAGTERFRSIVPFYLRDADVALVTYDITDRSSFENIHEWMRLLQEKGPITITCALVGNKSDLQEKCRVASQEAQRIADSYNWYFQETSAKTGDNIQKLFLDLGSIFTEKKSIPRATSVIHDSRENSLLSTGSLEVTRKSRSCC